MIATQKDNAEEMFPLVDEDGNIIGAATRGECHDGSKKLHPVVHLHVFNSQGELYLQKRRHGKTSNRANGTPPSAATWTWARAWKWRSAAKPQKNSA